MTIQEDERDISISITEGELAQRWAISKRTLQRWRGSGQGPPYLRIGGNVRYQLRDIFDFEDGQRNVVGR